MSEYKVHSELRNIGAKTVHTARLHRFTSDTPTEHHGTDTGPSPVEYLLGALGACLGASAAGYAHSPNYDIKIEKFAMDFIAETERYPDKSSKVTKIHVKIDSKTNLSKEENEKFVENVIHISTIHNTLQDSVEFSFEISND
ncbi:OsmC family protein [Lentilactobacillus sp. IMAU92037]|uniref:OsmC family protein n=1 Tax=Lentilactobacillus dabitei TaxID=2831523 RepID=UPI001C27A3FB|nr:OsmC family protein [Lentilactobacillus dabitei]MBU9789831.1 OsmC family protein [Lentilactobacillus dabitei]MBV0931427.1 OsmC family protein [Lentilactobacillus dabitei]